MSDMYVECLVKGKAKPTRVFFKWFLILATAVFGVMTLLGVIIAFIPAGICGIIAYYVSLGADIEYEYLYMDREITVDKVLAKTKRKRVDTLHVDRMEVVAPVSSYHLDGYKNRKVVVKDYSSGVETPEHKLYAIYYEGGVKILISASENLVKALKSVAPRKVFMD